MKYFIASVIFLAIVGGYIGLKFFQAHQQQRLLNPISVATEKPFDKYTFENLRKRKFTGDEIAISEKLNEGDGFISYLYFSHIDGKKVSGLINLPKKDGNYPVIVMIRGFVPLEIYQSGVGTQHGGEVLAKNGYITLAPDFLGYGASDQAPTTSLEDRFITYTTTLNLLASLNRLNPALETLEDYQIQADLTKVGLWGHSNGGHIALSVLEITGQSYPTVLWNPVSKPFPFSVLFFTDDYDDHGKALRQVISKFENDYDIEKYSPPNYIDWIKAPIQLHQAEKDTSVPWWWSQQLNDSLEKKDKDIEYFIYPGEDHNFGQGTWSTVMTRSMNFYNKEFNK